MVDGLSNFDEAILAKGLKIRSGKQLMDAATKTIVTGLTTVAKVVASLDDDPVAGCQYCTATIGDQNGAPAAGSIILKIWKATATADTAVVAGTTLTKYVSWIAIGT